MNFDFEKLERFLDAMKDMIEDKKDGEEEMKAVSEEITAVLRKHKMFGFVACANKEGSMALFEKGHSDEKSPNDLTEEEALAFMITASGIAQQIFIAAGNMSEFQRDSIQQFRRISKKLEKKAERLGLHAV